MRWWVISRIRLERRGPCRTAPRGSFIPKSVEHKTTTVTVFEAKPKKEKPKEPDKPKDKPPEPPKPMSVPKQVLKQAAAAAAQEHAPAHRRTRPAGGSRGDGCHARLRVVAWVGELAVAASRCASGRSGQWPVRERRRGRRQESERA